MSATGIEHRKPSGPLKYKLSCRRGARGKANNHHTFTVETEDELVAEIKRHLAQKSYLVPVHLKWCLRKGSWVEIDLPDLTELQAAA